MRTGSFPSSWFGLAPTRRLTARYWLKVIETLRASGHDPDQASEQQVRTAIKAVDKNPPEPRARNRSHR
jgi:hypothetical protein